MDEIFQFILASLVIFVFGLGMILLVYFTTRKRRYIKKNGIEVDGEIVGSRAFYNPNQYNDIRYENTSYYISCKYITKNNEEIKKEFKDVSYRKGYIQAHPIGSKIKIIYLPEKPHESIVKSSSLSLGLVFMQIIGIGLFGLSAFVLYNGIMMTYFS